MYFPFQVSSCISLFDCFEHRRTWEPKFRRSGQPIREVMVRDLSSTYLFERKPEICSYDIIITLHLSPRQPFSYVDSIVRVCKILLTVFIFLPKKSKKKANRSRVSCSSLSSLTKFAARIFRGRGKYFNMRAIRYAAVFKVQYQFIRPLNLRFSAIRDDVAFDRRHVNALVVPREIITCVNSRITRVLRHA